MNTITQSHTDLKSHSKTYLRIPLDLTYPLLFRAFHAIFSHLVRVVVEKPSR